MFHYEASGKISRYVHRYVVSLAPELYVAEPVLRQTLAHLRSARGARETPVEGIVYWAGVRLKDRSAAMTCIVPQSAADSGSAKVAPMGNLEVEEQLSELGLRIIAQLHTHPGKNSKIGDVDAFYSWKPEQDFFYIILSDYARQGNFPEGCSFYFHAGNRHYDLPRSWIRNNLHLVPPCVDFSRG